jgi:DNA-binding NarL/FixJ family response regulator
MTKSTDELILEKLDQLLKVISVAITKDLKQGEQIAILSRAGLSPKTIAELLGTTSNTVSVALSGLRKTKGTHTKSVKNR